MQWFFTEETGAEESYLHYWSRARSERLYTKTTNIHAVYISDFVSPKTAQMDMRLESKDCSERPP